MSEFKVGPTRLVQGAGKLKKTATSIHTCEIKLSDIYREILSLDGNGMELVSKSIVACAVSISNIHNQLDDYSDKLTNIAQTYQEAETAVKEEKSAEIKGASGEENELASNTNTMATACSFGGGGSRRDTTQKEQGDDLKTEREIFDVDLQSYMERINNKGIPCVVTEDIIKKFKKEKAYKQVIFISPGVYALYEADIDAEQKIKICDGNSSAEVSQGMDGKGKISVSDGNNEISSDQDGTVSISNEELGKTLEIEKDALTITSKIDNSTSYSLGPDGVEKKVTIDGAEVTTKSSVVYTPDGYKYHYEASIENEDGITVTSSMDVMYNDSRAGQPEAVIEDMAAKDNGQYCDNASGKVYVEMDPDKIDVYPGNRIPLPFGIEVPGGVPLPALGRV